MDGPAGPDRLRALAELLPFLQPAALGRTWQEAAQTMVGGQAGMYFSGTFAGEQAAPADRSDLELLTFPALGTSFDAEHGHRRADQWLHAQQAAGRSTAARSSSVRRLGAGPGDLDGRRTRTTSRRRRCRSQRLLAAPGRPRRSSPAPVAWPSSSTVTRGPTSRPRPGCRPRCRTSSRSRAGPRRLPEDDPGVLGLARLTGPR